MAAPTYAKPAVRNAWADTAIPTTDIVDPGNAIVTEGWLETSQPPPRQYFNWVLNWSAAAVRYFCQVGVSAWDTSETYQSGAVVNKGGTLVQSKANANTGNLPSFSVSDAFWGPLAGYVFAPAGNLDYSQNNITNYVLTSTLTSTLASYVTQSSLTSQLANYVTNSSLASTLGSYLTIASAASTYVTNTSLASQLASYLTIASANTTYAPKISPAFSGIPTAPTAASGTVTSQLATTQFAVGTFVFSGNDGSFKLPSGIICQFGLVVGSTGGPQTVPFPSAFPSQCLSIVCTAWPNQGTLTTSNPLASNTGFTLTNFAAGNNTSWIAFGH